MRSKDPILTKLSRELETVAFHLATHQSHSDALALKSATSFKLCYPGVSGGWVVKLYIGGSQRVIGWCSNCAQAARFADMAVWRFWRFRRNTNRAPINSDFNLGMDAAKFESESESTASKLLDSIENHFRTTGQLSFDLNAAPNENIKLPPSTRMKWNLAWAKFKYVTDFLKSELNNQGISGVVYSEALTASLAETSKVVADVDNFFQSRNLR